MKKAILPIIIGYSAIIMLSGCQSSNDDSNISTIINSDLLSESNGFHSSSATSSSIRDNETNYSSTESKKEENSSSVISTSDINQSDIASSSSSQSSVTTSSSIKDNEINSSPNESKNESNSSSTSDKNISNTTSESNNSQTETPNSTSSESSGNNSMPNNSTPGNNVSEPGTVEIIDGLLELKRDGQARGEIEPGMKIDYRKATLAKGRNVTFNIDCKQKLATIKITLTDQKTGKYFEGSATGKGVISFDIDADGEYVVSIENCSDKATYFTIEYRIGDETNSI